MRRFTLLVFEKPKQALFDYKRKFLKGGIDHFVVSQGRATVFWKLPLTQGTRRKKDESSVLAGMVEGRGFEPPTSALRTPRSPN